MNTKTYTTVSTVRSAALFGCLVHLDVLDDEVIGVKTFGVRVGFGVFQERKKMFSRLDGPAGTGNTDLFA